ncbi:hypothetical protein AAFF_G00373750 [Aldrovandia affinis]|uniref:Ubiquitin-like domain-containing protein n=1 Tax=Aldrovandia affinis TaxID=143900 RepID=A0AAD7R6T6_9TELE|nr:hypothetical protein AAFF_G00373750 [Aldrovandia affinis]
MDQHPGARSSMTVHVHCTTGTRLELSVPPEETVEALKRRLARRLRVPRARLALLHRDTPLSSGRLQDFGITDGSKVTLVPTVEAGLMSQASRPEHSVTQALESLTETQVSDFLWGRSPLTLALRVGDHMMFVQLQLAAQQLAPAPSSSRSCKPGAVIESFISHAPGVFSGTFSGTLHPTCQDGGGRPRRDIGTILQILNDLLSATRHYQRARSPAPAPSPPPPRPWAATCHRAPATPARADPATENRATRCKVQRLQLLMQQRRLGRRARREGRGPYCWLPPRQAGHAHSHTSSAGRDYDDSVWKPEVKADLSSEFVMA